MFHDTRIRILLFVLLALAVGCEKSSTVVVSPGSMADVVVASAAGCNLTLREVESRANNVALLVAHRDGSTNRMERIRGAFRRGYAKKWVEDAALIAAAEAEKVTPSEAQLEVCRQNAWANFRAKGDKKYADMLAIPGFDRELWETEVQIEAMRAAMKEHWLAKFPPVVPADFADGVIAKILARNAELAVTNQVQYAKATNVWQKIVAGADFVAVAKAETELREEVEDDCEWAVLDDRFLAEEPVLCKWVKAAKPGDISPPILADGGILVVRLDRLEADEGFALSRIYIHLADVRPPASKAEIEADYRRREGEALFARKLAELVALAKPTFNGFCESENENKSKEGK